MGDAFALDETKLVLDLRDLGVSGYEAADWIFQHCNLTFELITHRHLMALISVADTEATLNRLIASVRAFYQWALEQKKDQPVPMPIHRDLGTELVMPPTKAFFGPNHAPWPAFTARALAAGAAGRPLPAQRGPARPDVWHRRQGADGLPILDA